MTPCFLPSFHKPENISNACLLICSTLHPESHNDVVLILNKKYWFNLKYIRDHSNNMWHSMGYSKMSHRLFSLEKNFWLQLDEASKGNFFLIQSTVQSRFDFKTSDQNRIKCHTTGGDGGSEKCLISVTYYLNGSLTWSIKFNTL